MSAFINLARGQVIFINQTEFADVVGESCVNSVSRYIRRREILKETKVRKRVGIQGTMKGK
jgi:hypothetical protein